MINWQILAMGTERVGQWWLFNHLKNDYSRLYYITEGSASFSVNGVSFRAEAGDLVYLPANHLINLQSSGHMAHRFIHFMAQFYQTDCAECFTPPYTFQITSQQIKAWDRLAITFQDLRLPWLNPFLAHPTATHQFEKIFNEMDLVHQIETETAFRTLFKPILNQLVPIDSARQHFKSAFSAWLQSNPNLPITRQTAADHLGISEAHFSVRFKQMMGQTLQRYLIHWRLDQAVQLLLGTQLPLKEVATNCGFTTYALFYKQFTAAFQHTPKAFRQTYAQPSSSEPTPSKGR